MSDAGLGDFRAVSATFRLLGYLALLGALVTTVALQRVQLALSREEARVWWASNGRDLINAASLALLTLALYLVGYGAPAALVLAASALLVLNLLETFLARWPQIPAPTVVSLAVALVLGAPVIGAPEQVHALLTRLAQALFG